MNGYSDFYPGVAVEVSKAVDPGAHMARYIAPSLSPGKSWLLVWACRGSDPYPLLVSDGYYTLSHRPSEPPEMPSWARMFEAVRS